MSITIRQNEIVWVKGHHFPFYFKRENENGNPVLFGDFSFGFIRGQECLIESEVCWEDIVYPAPKDKNIML